jgi:hypothetical protein
MWLIVQADRLIFVKIREIRGQSTVKFVDKISFADLSISFYNIFIRS